MWIVFPKTLPSFACFVSRSLNCQCVPQVHFIFFVFLIDWFRGGASRSLLFGGGFPPYLSKPSSDAPGLLLGSEFRAPRFVFSSKLSVDLVCAFLADVFCMCRVLRPGAATDERRIDHVLSVV